MNIIPWLLFALAVGAAGILLSDQWRCWRAVWSALRAEPLKFPEIDPSLLPAKEQA